MKSSIIPNTYEEWRHCITVECGLKLTASYISERISKLKNNDDDYTQQYLKLYGQRQHERVLEWFIRAQKAV